MLKALDRTQEEYILLMSQWLLVDILDMREQELVFQLWQAARNSLDDLDALRNIILREPFFSVLFSAVCKARYAGVGQ